MLRFTAERNREGQNKLKVNIYIITPAWFNVVKLGCLTFPNLWGHEIVLLGHEGKFLNWPKVHGSLRIDMREGR